MQIDLIKSKKFPRLFLAHADEVYRPLPEVQLMLPDRTIVQVYDLSLAGMAISASGLIGKLKIDQFFEAKIKIFNSADWSTVKVRVVRTTAQMIGLVFDTMVSEGRLKLDQPVKDQLVVNYIRNLDPKSLQQALQSDVWFHGPFDTNVFIWKKATGPGVQKMIVEYDNLIWIYTEGKIQLQKSLSATDEAKGYAAPLVETFGQKVSMGVSWMDRLVKTLDQASDNQGYLKEALQVLKLQRSQ